MPAAPQTCPHCGAAVTADDLYCPRCGQPLPFGQAPPQARRPAPSPPESPAAADDGPVLSELRLMRRQQQGMARGCGLMSLGCLLTLGGLLLLVVVLVLVLALAH